MKRNVNLYLLKSFLIIVLIVSVLGCASTKLYKPFSGPYPNSFNKLSAKHILLANELAKLPEIQDGISEIERSAIDQLSLIYENYPVKFNVAFNEMYKIGIPDYRKYCSPLQAFFWLIEDGKNQTAEEILDGYSLNKLLLEAWETNTLPKSTLSKDEILEIVKNGVVGKNFNFRRIDLKSSYDANLRNYSELTDVVSKKNMVNFFREKIILDYQIDKRRFTRKARNVIKKSITESSKTTADMRWNGLDTVAARLNSPELVSYWFEKNISYGRPRIGYTQFAEVTFKDKVGDCSDQTELVRYLLRGAGYSVTKYCTSGHVFCVVSNDSIYWLFDVNYPPMGQTADKLNKFISLDLIFCGKGTSP